MRMILCLALLSFTTYAKEIVLATVTNDVYATPYEIGLTIDDQNGDIVNFYVDNEKNVRMGTYKPKQLERGVPLYQSRGFTVVKVFSKYMDITKEADFDIELLYSGLTRKKVIFKVRLEKRAGKWHAVYENATFDKIHLLANRSRLLGPIGIAQAVINGERVDLQ